MNALPILLRELRAQGRRPGAYLMRAVIAATALLLCLDDLLGENPDSSRSLARTTTLLMILFAFGAGFAVSDAIGSERRRGTLGLLLLTPLRPYQVLLGKVACQGAHFLLCLAAAAPIICLPLLVGGITWQEAAVQCFNLMVATLIGLSAGLLATVCFRQPWASSSTCLLLLAFILFAPALNTYHTQRDSPGLHSLESFWLLFEERTQPPMVPSLPPSGTDLNPLDREGPLKLPSLASPPSGGAPGNPWTGPTRYSETILILMTSAMNCAMLLVLALFIFWMQSKNEQDPGEERPGAKPMPRWIGPILGGAFMACLFLMSSGFPVPGGHAWLIVPFLGVSLNLPWSRLNRQFTRYAIFGWLCLIFLSLLIIPPVLEKMDRMLFIGLLPFALLPIFLLVRASNASRDAGKKTESPSWNLAGICVMLLHFGAVRPLAHFVLPLLIPGLLRNNEPERGHPPGKGRGSPGIGPVLRRRLRLPDGCNPCQELARALTSGWASTGTILVGAVLFAALLPWLGDMADPYPLILLILIEMAVRWSLTAGILRQYGLARGGPLELALGSSLSDREARRGLARAALRTHLWKPGLAALGHLILLLEDSGASLAGFHLASLLLIWLEAHAIHMAGASLALRGYGRTAATLGLFGAFCLLPLATILLLPAILPLPPAALMDAALILRLACALLGALCILDLRRIRRMVNDPDHRGITGLLFPRRERAAQP